MIGCVGGVYLPSLEDQDLSTLMMGRCDNDLTLPVLNSVPWLTILATSASTPQTHFSLRHAAFAFAIDRLKVPIYFTAPLNERYNAGGGRKLLQAHAFHCGRHLARRHFLRSIFSVAGHNLCWALAARSHHIHLQRTKMLSPIAYWSMFALSLLLTLLPQTTVATTEEPLYVKGTVDGKIYLVRDDRRPALYTGDYGDCLGESAINVTRFDAAYYQDNMTLLFHLAGETALAREDTMMSIGVFAYGESRFDLTFNPCDANIER